MNTIPKTKCGVMNSIPQKMREVYLPRLLLELRATVLMK